MHMKLVYVACALGLVSAPVFAQAQVQQGIPQPVAPTKVSQSKSDLDKIVCQSEDTLGSRLERHQVCMTKQQWWTYEQENKQKVQQMQIIGYQAH